MYSYRSLFFPYYKLSNHAIRKEFIYVRLSKDRLGKIKVKFFFCLNGLNYSEDSIKSVTFDYPFLKPERLFFEQEAITISLFLGPVTGWQRCFITQKITSVGNNKQLRFTVSIYVR